MTKEEQIADLTGQVLALTLYVRALIDKHPRASDVLSMADSEIESLISSILANPMQDSAIDGIERIRKRVKPASR